MWSPRARAPHNNYTEDFSWPAAGSPGPRTQTCKQFVFKLSTSQLSCSYHLTVAINRPIRDQGPAHSPCSCGGSPPRIWARPSSRSWPSRSRQLTGNTAEENLKEERGHRNIVRQKRYRYDCLWEEMLILCLCKCLTLCFSRVIYRLTEYHWWWCPLASLCSVLTRPSRLFRLQSSNKLNMNGEKTLWYTYLT